MDIFLMPETWIALLTLTFMEIVLGVDNIIFISIVSNKLKDEEQKKARLFGLALALIIRIVLLASITYIIGMNKPLFVIPWLDHEVSIRVRTIQTAVHAGIQFYRGMNIKFILYHIISN